MIVQEPGFQLKEINPKYKTITKNEIIENAEKDNSPEMTENIPYHRGPEYNQPGFNSHEDDNYSVVYAQLNKGKNDLCFVVQPNSQEDQNYSDVYTQTNKEKKVFCTYTPPNKGKKNKLKEPKQSYL